MGKGRKNFYAVRVGRTPGIYLSWFGKDGAEEQIRSFPGAQYKGFLTLDEAQEYLDGSLSGDGHGNGSPENGKLHPDNTGSSEGTFIYTDGGCINNPGPGGYGVVLVSGGVRTELTGGYRFTTNNRMELRACIMGLRALENGYRKPVTVITDSRYVVNGIMKGWARRWQKNNWMRDKHHSAENVDLWADLLDLVLDYGVRFEWVKGHAGHPENERCDELAKASALLPDLPPDVAFEKGETKISTPSLFEDSR